VNGEPVKRPKTKGADYVSVQRDWQRGDRVEVEFAYDFHLKTMPDDENVLAIFYGPLLLAFDGGGEIVLKGTEEDILKGLVGEGDDCKVFYLNNAGRKFRLMPLMLIETEEYSVYATINNIFFME
jgi:hypothetical protein